MSRCSALNLTSGQAPSQLAACALSQCTAGAGTTAKVSRQSAAMAATIGALGGFMLAYQNSSGGRMPPYQC